MVDWLKDTGGAMEQRRKRLALRAIFLGAIPLVVMTSIGVFLLRHGQAWDGRSTLAVGVIVAAVSASSVIYQAEGWSLPRQSLAHFVGMAITVLPALLLSGWFRLDTLAGVLLVVGLFLLVGLVLRSALFLIIRLLERRHAERERSRA